MRRGLLCRFAFAKDTPRRQRHDLGDVVRIVARREQLNGQVPPWVNTSSHELEAHDVAVSGKLFLFDCLELNL